MLSRVLKLALLGGVGYLLYKHFYSTKKNDVFENKDIENIKDGRTTYYGDSKEDYVRGFPMPNNINDIKGNKVFVITKPKQYVFGEKPKSMFEVELKKETNRVTYNNNNNIPVGSEYVADYDKIKDKLLMNEKNTK